MAGPGNLGRIGRLPSVLLGLLSLALLSGARQTDLEALVAEARAAGDAAPPALFQAIARRGGPSSLDALRRALGSVNDPERLIAGYSAYGVYRGGRFEREAIRRLARIAFDHPARAHRVAAVHALVALWLPARDALEKVARRHPDPECRALALAPLLPELSAEGGRAACELVLRAGDLSGPLRTGVIAALERFRDHGSELAMLRALGRPEVDPRWKLLLLDILARRDGPAIDAALERRVEDEDRAVRLRALARLAERDGERALAALERLADEGDEGLVVEALLALGERRSADPAWIGELAEFTRSTRPEVRRAAVRMLTRIRTKEGLWLLHRLMHDTDWRVAMQAVRAVGGLRQRASIPRLIELLRRPDRRLRAEAREQLELLTGLDLGETAERWSRWFEDRGAAFVMPSLEEALAARRRRGRASPQEGRTATFYGLRVDSSRVAFVIDTSGSMSTPAAGSRSRTGEDRPTRLDVARRELGEALDRLIDGERFNVITFASDVTPFADHLVALDPRTRRQARRFLEALRADGATALFEGLAYALSDAEVDTVFLLTDGEPSAGRFEDPHAIREAIRRLDRDGLVRIHTVAIGHESDLLRGLAEDSGGQYRSVR